MHTFTHTTTYSGEVDGGWLPALKAACVDVTTHSKLPMHAIQSHPALGSLGYTTTSIIWCWCGCCSATSSSQVVRLSVQWTVLTTYGRGSHCSLSQWSHDPSQSHSPQLLAYVYGTDVLPHCLLSFVLCTTPMLNSTLTHTHTHARVRMHIHTHTCTHTTTHT